MGTTGVWEEMPEADFGGRVCALPPGQQMPADKGAPLACFNRFPWQEEGRWGKAHRPPRRGCPAGTERPDLELLRECSGALRQSCQQTDTCDPETRPGPNEDSSRTVSFNYSKHRVLDNYRARPFLCCLPLHTLRGTPLSNSLRTQHIGKYCENAMHVEPTLISGGSPLHSFCRACCCLVRSVMILPGFLPLFGEQGSLFLPGAAICVCAEQISKKRC